MVGSEFESGLRREALNSIAAQTIFLVICARTDRVRSTTGFLFQKYVYSTFSMKMVLNYIHIWSVNYFLVKDKVPGRNWTSV